MRRPKPSKPKRPARARMRSSHRNDDQAGIDAGRVAALRELFWHNVVRETLTSLSMLSARAESRTGGTPDPADQILDGRLAVITNAGERIPIAHVTPLFACGVPGTEAQRALSIAVECTVFQITAPSGEQYTLPLHEIRGVHALTDELMKQLHEESRAQSGAGLGEPFGFAAFTSLARAEQDEDASGSADAGSGPAI
ncbi:MAG: hypothetical protein FJ255_00940 [Phycisphaerae bacterium]|nr:hypothetical protein [Phycisphaerae bacterium]